MCCFKNNFIGVQHFLVTWAPWCYLTSQVSGSVFRFRIYLQSESYDANMSSPMMWVQSNLFFTLGNKRYVCNCLPKATSWLRMPQSSVLLLSGRGYENPLYIPFRFLFFVYQLSCKFSYCIIRRILQIKKKVSYLYSLASFLIVCHLLPLTETMIYENKSFRKKVYQGSSSTCESARGTPKRIYSS